MGSVKGCTPTASSGKSWRSGRRWSSLANSSLSTAVRNAARLFQSSSGSRLVPRFFKCLVAMKGVADTQIPDGRRPTIVIIQSAKPQPQHPQRVTRSHFVAELNFFQQIECPELLLAEPD